IWVLDLDGATGEKSLRTLVEQHGVITSQFTVKTGTGWHLYFLWPPTVEIRNSASKIGEGLDVRGDGGYVLAPGSVHPSGAIYTSSQNANVPEAPDWLLQLAASPARKGRLTADSNHGRGPGQRHERLIHIIGRMLKDGMGQAAILAGVLAENETFNPPKPEEDVRNLIADVMDRYAKPERKELTTSRRAEIVHLSEVRARDVAWLWRPYLPNGMLAMLSGDPGAGKTFLAMAIAASLTTGHVPYSQEICTPVDVLYLSVENDPACVVRPRFDA